VRAAPRRRAAPRKSVAAHELPGERAVEGDPAVFPHLRARRVVVRFERKVVEHIAGTHRNLLPVEPEHPLPPDRPEQLCKRLLSRRNILRHLAADLEVPHRARVDRQRQVRQQLRIRPVNHQHVRLPVVDFHICPKNTMIQPGILFYFHHKSSILYLERFKNTISREDYHVKNRIGRSGRGDLRPEFSQRHSDGPGTADA